MWRLVRNINIKTKLLIGFLIIFLILLSVGIQDYFILIRYQEKKDLLISNIQSIETVKDARFRISQTMLYALKILNSNDISTLEQNWQEHGNIRVEVNASLNKLKDFSRKIGDDRFKSNKKKIENAGIEIAEDYNKNIITTITQLKNLREDILEKPVKKTKQKEDSDEGGIVYQNEETDNKANKQENNEEALKNLDEDEEDDEEEENDDDENDKTKETTNAEIIYQSQDTDSPEAPTDSIDFRQKKLNDANNYIHSTGVQIIKNLYFIEHEIEKIIKALEGDATEIVDSSRTHTITIVLSGMILSIIIALLIGNNIANPIEKLRVFIYKMGEGELPEQMLVESKDEIGNMTKGLNHLVASLRKTAEFSFEIGRGNFSSKFEPQSSKDVLGNSLIDMRKSLQEAKEEEQKRKIEDQQRTWATEGLALFGEILRQHTGNMEMLAQAIVKNIVKYLNANQSGLFVFNDKDEKAPYLNLIATYAYSRQRYMQKRIKLGEGLVGMCALEKYTIYMTDVPNEYIEIESGLGNANPNCILIVPLKMENNILGVLEMASFNEFLPHEIELVERITESIATTLSSIKISAQTADLLEQSQKQAVEMHEQEEKMRENIDMMKEKQEEAIMQRKEMRKELQKNVQEKKSLLAELEQKKKDIVQLKKELNASGIKRE
ncbi:MAG: hypothetical protein CSA05_01400 [Bacteroidia bacterium]|nr:MAG: hypothetical protein CSA05_01400 [Bacteroidia bacterium]